MPIDPAGTPDEPARMLVIGAGGHAKVVVDAARCACVREIVVVDDRPERQGTILLGLPVQAAAATDVSCFHVAIGDNAVRERKFLELASRLRAASIIHPLACVADTATVGAGSLLAARAVVGPDAVVGEGCIVNHGAVVDHDCVLGPFCHVAPNATLAGSVRLGSRVLVGAGANILPGVSVGDGCVVGAGAVVLADLPAGTVHAGVPAIQLHRKIQ